MAILLGIGNIEKVSYIESSNTLSVTYVDGHTDDVTLSGITNNTTSIDNEVSNRESADASIRSMISTNVSALQSADKALQSNIDSEISRAKSKEADLQSAIDAVDTTTIATNLSNEITRAKNAEQTNATNISANASNISTINDTLDSISTTLTSVSAKTDAEAQNRSNADASLQSNIDEEVSRAKSKEATLQSNIDEEATARANADSALTTRFEKNSCISHRFYVIYGQPTTGKQWVKIASSQTYIAEYASNEISFFYTYDWVGTTYNAVGFCSYRMRLDGNKAIQENIFNQVHLNGDKEQTFKVTTYVENGYQRIEVYAKMTSWTAMQVYNIATFWGENLVDNNTSNEKWWFHNSGTLTSSDTWTDGATANCTNTIKSVIYSDTYTLDDSPAQDSVNLVKSGGVWSMLNTTSTLLMGLIDAKSSQTEFNNKVNYSNQEELSITTTKCVISESNKTYIITSAVSGTYIVPYVENATIGDKIIIVNRTQYSIPILYGTNTMGSVGQYNYCICTYFGDSYGWLLQH